MATLGTLTFNECLPKQDRTRSQTDIEQQLERSNALLMRIFDIIPTSTHLDLGYVDRHILSEITATVQRDEDYDYDYDYERGYDSGHSAGWDAGYHSGRDENE